MRVTPRLCRALAVFSPTSPVPATSTRQSRRSPKIFSARSTETVATLTWPAPIGTLLRMYFAAWNPFWKTRLSTAPTTPCVVARA